MNDCHETKAAVIAAKESCELPVIVSNAYDRSGKLMTGASVEAMVAMLEGLRVDAIGLNCSFGPDVVLEIIDEFTGSIIHPDYRHAERGTSESRKRKHCLRCFSGRIFRLYGLPCQKGHIYFRGMLRHYSRVHQEDN